MRAYSVYNFTRWDPSQPYSDIAQGAAFSDYLRWALRKEPGSIVIRDYQVVHLSEASWRGGNILKTAAERLDLEQACQLLTDWGIVGLVEQFELSSQVFQATYGPKLPGFKLLPNWENATGKKGVSTEEQLGDLRQELGEALYSDFMEANQLDLALYSHARSVLDQAIIRAGLTASQDSIQGAPVGIECR
ncbi:hypothetical protein GCM10007862_30810 [Dyella lipolytica]|nr:hypothetical protein GCM10007862_30810 [Dyella lipolytica]